MRMKEVPGVASIIRLPGEIVTAWQRFDSPGRQQHRYFLHDLIVRLEYCSVCQENPDNSPVIFGYRDMVLFVEHSGLRFSEMRISASAGSRLAYAMAFSLS